MEANTASLVATAQNLTETASSSLADWLFLYNNDPITTPEPRHFNLHQCYIWPGCQSFTSLARSYFAPTNKRWYVHTLLLSTELGPPSLTMFQLQQSACVPSQSASRTQRQGLRCSVLHIAHRAHPSEHGHGMPLRRENYPGSSSKKPLGYSRRSHETYSAIPTSSKPVGLKCWCYCCQQLQDVQQLAPTTELSGETDRLRVKYTSLNPKNSSVDACFVDFFSCTYLTTRSQQMQTFRASEVL